MDKVTASLVHVVLGHSYLMYFFWFLIGFTLYLVFPAYPFLKGNAKELGLLFLMAGTLLVIWAQGTSRKTHSERNSTPSWDDFYHGPYTVTRSPTHLGLALTMLGAAFIFNSICLLVTAVISFFLTRYIFVKKEEQMLSKKYGVTYREYQKHVRF